MKFQAISPFALNLFTRPSGCPTYRWGLQTAAGASILYTMPLCIPKPEDVFAISAVVKRAETILGREWLVILC